MKKAGIIVLFALLFSACSEKEQANFIVFLVDDLGWADVACNNPQTFYETQ